MQVFYKIFLFFLILIFTFFSCKKKQEVIPKVTIQDSYYEGDYLTYKFMERDLQGKVNNIPWVYKDGKAFIKNNLLKIQLYRENFLDSCQMLEPTPVFKDNYYLDFYLPIDTGYFNHPIDSLGITQKDFKYNWSYYNLISRTTIYISKIDTTSGFIEGKLRSCGSCSNSESRAFYVNGMFKIRICK